MKYASYMYVLPVVLLLAFLFYSGAFDGEKPQPSGSQTVEQAADAAPGKWETKIDEQPPVTVKITPIELGKDATEWEFSVIFDTHVGSLDDDPMQVAVLRDDQGSIQKPIAWEGAGPGGHHREGILVFEAVNPVPPSIEVSIKDVGGVPERSFKWDMNK